jgi:hypothetical protein
MPLKNRLLPASLLIFLTALLAVWLAPFAVSHSLRLWIWWKAREQKLTVKIDQIDAPFLRPVVVRGFRMTSAPDAAFQIDVSAAQATVNLNLKAILTPMDGRAIRTLSVEGLHAELRRNNTTGTTLTEKGWATLQKLLPGSLNLGPFDLRVEDGPTVILLRSVSLSASQIEAGRFSADEVTIASPWFRQTFSQLRGATNWQDTHLTLGGLSLTRGLDVPSLTADFSHLGIQRVGLEFDADVFGGKIRASISNEWRSRHSNWDVVGSATDISLAQTSEALGFTDRVGGLVRACKFTFRGNPRNPMRATAWLWTELTGLTWRERAADVIMLGAALYNRQIQLQQLYVKQDTNEFTLSGETSFPANSSDWLRPDFRGDISASISNLGDFASLFGANPGDFAGKIAIDGTMNARDRKIGGHLTVNGAALKLFKTSIDVLNAKLNLKATEIEVERLELERQGDFVHAQGKVDTVADHHYAGTLSAALANIADYAQAFPAAWRGALREGPITLDWSGNGNANSHSGAFHINGRGIRLALPNELAPFDAQLDGAYSPGNLFFRQLQLANEHASLTAFATVASKYVQLQALAFDLNGKPTLRGNFFLPFSLSKIFQGSSLLDALDAEQKADLDLAVEPTNLADLSAALTGHVTMSGTFAARLSIFGGLDALQGWSEMHLRDFAVANDPARLSSDAQTRFASGMMTTKAGFLFRGGDPISLDLGSQIYLGHERSRAALEPISANIDLPAIFLVQLPRYLSHDLFRDGILSGKMSISETLRYPKISGDLQLINGKLIGTSLPAITASGRVAFNGKTASLDFANISTHDVDLSLRGEVDFSDPEALAVKVSGIQPMVDLTPRAKIDCIAGINFMSAPQAGTVFPMVDRLDFRGSAFRSDWRVTLSENINGRSFGALDKSDATRTFQFCRGAQPDEEMLVLGSEPRLHFPLTVRPRKRAKHR